MVTQEWVSNLLFHSYLGGILWVAIGLIIIMYVKTYPQDKKGFDPIDMKYWVSGIGILFIGVSMIIALLFE